MKIITSPEVVVVGKTEFRPHPKYPIPEDWSGSKEGGLLGLGAFAAKGCYDSFGNDEKARSCADNQREVVRHRHGSVLEHLNITVFVEGITRACSLEFNRHRPLAISQRSTRYTEENGAALVLEPYYAELYEKHYKGGEAHEPWALGREYTTLEMNEFYLIDNHLQAAQRGFESYDNEVRRLLDMNPKKLAGKDLRKWARGKARNILPHGLETRVTYTGNLRAWRWVTEARSHRDAETEVRRLAHHVMLRMQEEAPLYFEDFRVNEIIDGIPEYVTDYRKV